MSEEDVLCKNFKVYYMNGSGSLPEDIDHNLRLISNVIFKEPRSSGRVENIFNSNLNYVKMPEDSLEETLRILTNEEVFSCSSRKIKLVFICHSYGATIIKESLSPCQLEKVLRQKFKEEEIDEKMKRVRESVAVFTVGCTKWIPKIFAKIAFNYRVETDVMMDFYKMVITDRLPSSEFQVVGRKKYKNAISIASLALYQIAADKMQGHHLKTYLQSSEWQNHLMEVLNIHDLSKMEYNCGCP